MRLFIIGVLCTVVTGCAGVKYSKDMRGIVVSEFSKQHWQIQVIGNGLAMSQKTANDYAMLRAADAALDAGYKNFEVLRGPASGPITSRSVIGSTTTATGAAYGNMAYVSGTTTPTYSRASVSYGTLSIWVFNEPRKNADLSGCYDATKVKAELSKKYRL